LNKQLLAAVLLSSHIKVANDRNKPLFNMHSYVTHIFSHLWGAHVRGCCCVMCLQEGSPPFDDATAAAIIHSELGRPPSQLFAWLSPTPVASASLGQVYQARLAADGTLVAVKVSEPGVALAGAGITETASI
jgi:hypothetical protein